MQGKGRPPAAAEAVAGSGPPPRLPQPGRLTPGDLLAALKAGWHDFRAAPAYGLFFSGVYVSAGLALLALRPGALIWVLTLSLGFPLLAPFAAVGLYEVSRRIEALEPLGWREVLGVVVAERGRQTVWLGAIMAIAFLFWSLFAHLLFALVMGITALGTGQPELAAFLSPAGAGLLAAQLALGGLTAFVIYGLMVMALPLCLDMEVDFVTAMLLSLRTVAANRLAMTLWAALLAGLTLLGMLPGLLGLLMVLPVLGHASWHLYRRALYLEPVAEDGATAVRS